MIGRFTMPFQGGTLTVTLEDGEKWKCSDETIQKVLTEQFVDDHFIGYAFPGIGAFYDAMKFFDGTLDYIKEPPPVDPNRVY